MTAPSAASVRSGNLVHLGQIRRRRRQKYLINCLKVTLATVFVGLVMIASPRARTTSLDPWSTMERTTTQTQTGKNVLSESLPVYDGIETLLQNKGVDGMLKEVDKRSHATTHTSVDMLRKRLQTYMITGSAHRAVKSARRDGSLSIWVAGSSTAAGAGNLPSQSYASILPALLAFERDVSFSVNSSAMFSIAPFPNAWCLPGHHWGRNEVPEVVVYDFEEAIAHPDPMHLETFIRMVATLRPDVMIIIRGPPNDSAHERLLQAYTSVVNIVIVADLSGEVLGDATGFGLPASVESLHGHTLSIQQHAWTALVMAMHIAAASRQTVSNEALRPARLPPSVHPPSKLMLHPTTDTLHCRTSYDFVDVVREERGQELRYDTSSTSTANLQELVIGENQQVDWKTATSLLLLPKNPSNFRRGWAWGVADRMSKLRQTTFHHRDWKVATYGLSMSGPLQLELPSSDDGPVSSIMVCQADDGDASPTETCSLGRDGVITANLPLTTVAAYNNMCLFGRLDQMTRQVSSVLVNVTVSSTRKPCSVAHVIWTTAKRL